MVYECRFESGPSSPDSGLAQLSFGSGAVIDLLADQSLIQQLLISLDLSNVVLKLNLLQLNFRLKNGERRRERLSRLRRLCTCALSRPGDLRRFVMELVSEPLSIKLLEVGGEHVLAPNAQLFLYSRIIGIEPVNLCRQLCEPVVDVRVGEARDFRSL